eukprot:gene6800-13771_t
MYQIFLFAIISCTILPVICLKTNAIRNLRNGNSLFAVTTPVLDNSLLLSGNDLVGLAAKSLMERFWEIDQQTKRRMDAVLSEFERERIDASAFHGVNGYGHGDIGREKFDAVVARLLGAEAALVRVQLFSGTHAIASALFGCLRPGDKMLCVSGHPYDTLEEVIGLRPGHQTGTTRGSLLDWGIGYSEIDLLTEEDSLRLHKRLVSFDLNRIDNELAADPNIKLIHVQRYKSQGRELIVFVDNCYGELVEDREPTHVGADLMAGSLIKNLGGTLAPCGGYIAGRQDLVAAAT